MIVSQAAFLDCESSLILKSFFLPIIADAMFFSDIFNQIDFKLFRLVTVVVIPNDFQKISTEIYLTHTKIKDHALTVDSLIYI